MSAIFGIIDLLGRPIDPEWIKSMQTDLAHRGSDGEGLYQEKSMFLGHKLLKVTPESIYDKSPYEEDGFVITANARLDERDAIMDRLHIETAERDKITDGLLLLRSFRKFGKDFVKDIYGDFTFAIWDKEKKELFCVRDQMGVKPFLYYFQDNRFVFSTELKSIVKLPFIKTEIDHSNLRDRAIGIMDEPEKTNWKNISRLKPANKIEINGLNLLINQYWIPTYTLNPKYKSVENSAFALRDLIEKTIADRMRVIGNIGIPLSGGLDSGTIACVAARQLASKGKRVMTISSILDPSAAEPGETDEIEFIQSVLDQEKNIDPAFVKHSDLGFLYNIEEQFDRKYAPVNDYHYVESAFYRQYKSNSVCRVLSGYLGDDTVSNKALLPLPILLLTGRFTTFLRLSILIKRNMQLTMLKLIKSHIISPVMPLSAKKMWSALKGMNDRMNVSLLPLKINKTEKKVLQKRMNLLCSRSPPLKDLSGDIWPTNCDNFEEEWDCRSSHHQVEITYPFADRRIVELLLQIPAEHFYADGYRRGLIKKAMTGILPDKIRERNDKGYYSPGYFQIFRDDISKIKDLIENEVTNDQIFHFLDFKKMINTLNSLDKPKKEIIFGSNYYVIHQLSIWLKFNKWLNQH
jgi:asparagine synthase (glutamine-hydrolysing)